MKCTLGDERLQRSRRSLWCRPWLITFIFPLKTYIMIKGRRNSSRFAVWTSCEHVPQTQRDCLQKRWYESAWVRPRMKSSSSFSLFPTVLICFLRSSAAHKAEIFPDMWRTCAYTPLFSLIKALPMHPCTDAAAFTCIRLNILKVFCINTSHLSKCPNNNRPV